MGVKGLYTYIQEEKDTFLRNYKLHNTRLIIDGPNLVNQLYAYYRIPSQFGGDYNIFSAKVCENFIYMLRYFNVEPIVIFDGADDPSNIKYRTHMFRLKKRSDDTRMICDNRGNVRIPNRDNVRIPNRDNVRIPNQDNDRISVLPLLAELTFKQALVKLNVAHACCLFEGDWQIASLANKFGCPVLSGDSDFYVFELDVGYININDLFASLELLDTSAMDDFLRTKIYNRDCRRKLIKELSMGTDEYVLPVFATLVGNDYFNYSKSQYWNQAAGVLSKNGYKSTDYVHIVIDWICRSRFRNGNAAFRQLLAQMHNEQKKIFNMSVQSYFDVQSDVEPGIDFDLLAEIQKTELARNSDSVSDLPEWFIQSLIRCESNANYLLNIVVNKRLIFKSQIENHKVDPSFDCSKEIRNVIYGLLIGSRPECMTAIKEYHRDESNCQEVKRTRSLQNFQPLPNLGDINTTNGSSRKALLYAVFGDMIQSIPDRIEDTSKIVILMLRLWKRNSRSTEVQLKTFIISFIAMDICNPDGPNLCRDILRARDGDECTRLLVQMRSYMERSRDGGNFDIDIIHKYAQFQSIYRDVLFLNQLLSQPVRIPDPRNLLNGTLICNAFHRLQRPLQPETILGGINSSFFKLFDEWFKIIIQLTDSSQELLYSRRCFY